ncbi:MAG TPA: 23S rRNA (guanosine(2251)-2'-O)-methyltransferase RlmB [Caulobacteraceae bacterium]
MNGRRGPARTRADKDGAVWIWGWHAVAAALENPARAAPLRLLATPERARELQARRLGAAALEILPAAQIARELPPFAAHQGVALKAMPLAPATLEAMADPAAGVILMLDQLTDPQNVGALFRSAAAFGARGVVLQDRHAPALAGALAKAAAGAIERLPHARVTNLSRALEQLAGFGWRAVGLDAAASEPLAAVLDSRPVVLVMGSEGEGLRRLVAEHCDALGHIPMPGAFESLNVSAAAAIALYEATRNRSGAGEL